MVLSIEIPPQVEVRLRQQANAAGKDVCAYVSQLVEQAAAKTSLDESLAPVHRKFAASGISEEELIEDITSAQAEYRNEKKSE